MSHDNKTIVEALDDCFREEPRVIVIRASPRADEPVIEVMTSFGKRGKKGKSNKDWN